jgi:hypothetical protein
MKTYQCMKTTAGRYYIDGKRVSKTTHDKILIESDRIDCFQTQRHRDGYKFFCKAVYL